MLTVAMSQWQLVLVLRMLKVAMLQQILRLIEIGIENANSCCVTVDMSFVEIGIENTNSHFVTADIEACLHWYREC